MCGYVVKYVCKNDRVDNCIVTGMSHNYVSLHFYILVEIYDGPGYKIVLITFF